jgi:Icc-related predicted phosphoesterase
MQNLKIWHLSDTHTLHDNLEVPKDVGLIIHSGDCSNSKSPYINEQQVLDFIEWYSKINKEYKIYVAGNHDCSLEARLVTKQHFTDAGIIYLENEYIDILGLRIWGSPYTPSFFNWAFMKARHKLYDIWATIPEDTDIVVTHGPPKGILDLSYDKNGKLEYCGCESLRKRIYNINPKLHLFGHIHDNEDNFNAGTRTLPGRQTVYSNGACMKDGKFTALTHKGIFHNVEIL